MSWMPTDSGGMNKIVCKLFGVPQIWKDGQQVLFPYAKLSAFFYYLLISKFVSRDEISGFLWPEENNEVARRNLRNAIYQIKKVLGEDVILSPQKSTLKVNDALDIEVDVDMFVEDPQKNLSLYTGTFLQGIFLKDSETYEYWLLKQRNFYKRKFSLECRKKIETDLKNRNYTEIEELAQYLIETDEYDERSFRLLMRLYQETGRHGKAIETYYQLTKILRQELGISPDQATKELYERSLNEVYIGEGALYSNEELFFRNRDQVFALLEKEIRQFKEGRPESRAILITGEPGSGRSTIRRRLLEDVGNAFWVIEVQNLPSQQSIPLRAWNIIAEQLTKIIEKNNLIPTELWKKMMREIFPDFWGNYPEKDFLSAETAVPLHKIAHIFAEAFKNTAQIRPVFLVLENLHWMDRDSLKLLTHVLLETPSEKVSMLATVNREQSWELRSTLLALKHSRQLFTVELERFSFEACHQIIKELFPNDPVSGEWMEKIYNETEGTPFLMNEYIKMLKQGEELNPLSPAIRDFLGAQFVGLSQEALNLASILSYFYEGASFSFLVKLLEKDEEQLIGPLEELETRGLVRENAGGDLSFTHGKLPVYLYAEQSEIHKRLLHQKIALMMEASGGKSENISRNYSQLVYHFTAAGDRLRALKYKIANMNQYLDVGHEIFPVVNREEIGQDQTSYISRDKIEMMFHKLEAEIEQVRKNSKPSERLEQLEIEFFYMKGRYSILEGHYERGVRDISYVIKKSKQNGQTGYTFEGYKQLLYYYIQVNDAESMAEYIELTFDLAVKRNNHKEIGVLLRLKGLYYMMVGEDDKAEQLLNESINTFTITEQTRKDYAVNIAAAYNYIGEIYLGKGELRKALLLFDKAVTLCPVTVFSGLSVFYLNAGKALYFLRDYAHARERFEKVYSMYGEFDLFWLRSSLDAYMALVLIEEEEFAQALSYLNMGRKNRWRMRYPGDIGTVFMAEALIRKRAEENAQIDTVFKASLLESVEYYTDMALKNLDQYLNRYEIFYLQSVLKENPEVRHTLKAQNPA